MSPALSVYSPISSASAVTLRTADIFPRTPPSPDDYRLRCIKPRETAPLHLARAQLETEMNAFESGLVDYGVAPARRNDLLNAANTLSDARRTKTTIPSLPENLRPTSENEAYFIQDQVALAYGDIGGWKIGAASPEAEPLFAPMPSAWTAGNDAEFRAVTYRAVEAEVAFLLGHDLPPRSHAYTDDEVLAAVGSCHPAIEILDSAFEDPTAVDRFSGIADLQLHGGFAFGPAFADWRNLDFARETVTLSIDGIVRLERTGSNTAGNLLRLLPWLANHAAARTGGLRAGQWITTGSWTGSLRCETRSTAIASFSHLGTVSVHFAPEQNLEKGLPGVTRRFS